MTDLYNASLGIKTALILGVESINLQKAEVAAQTYNVPVDNYLKVWDFIFKDFRSGKITRNRDILKYLKENNL